ncbi:MAG: nucleoside hydrolase [Gracilibacter sp. BRH_c7a]|nr:MAG: nucleoside hydrolase [Gracilibacter sp. BRH_c7a]
MEKIIFDCDNTMGIHGCDVDDGLALLYLLGKKSLKICGITTTYGNSDIETVYACTAAMLKEIGRSDIPILKGCPDKESLNSEAAEFLVKTINDNKGNISILATGSLTNLLAAYLIDSTILMKTKQIVIMGGISQELIINGEILDELNFSCDPVAADCVLKNGKNVSVITGNNCLDAFFTQDDFEKILIANSKPIAKYITRKCSYWFEDMMNMFKINGFYNWDVVAAAYLLEPSLFNNNYQYIEPNIENLQKGLLCFRPNNRESERESYLINIPLIADLNSFTADIYNTWLEVEV